MKYCRVFFFPRETITTHTWTIHEKAHVKRKVTREQFRQKNWAWKQAWTISSILTREKKIRAWTISSSWNFALKKKKGPYSKKLHVKLFSAREQCFRNIEFPRKVHVRIFKCTWTFSKFLPVKFFFCPWTFLQKTPVKENLTREHFQNWKFHVCLLVSRGKKKTLL